MFAVFHSNATLCVLLVLPRHQTCTVWHNDTSAARASLRHKAKFMMAEEAVDKSVSTHAQLGSPHWFSHRRSSFWTFVTFVTPSSRRWWLCWLDKVQQADTCSPNKRESLETKRSAAARRLPGDPRRRSEAPSTAERRDFQDFPHYGPCKLQPPARRRSCSDALATGCRGSHQLGLPHLSLSLSAPEPTAQSLLLCPAGTNTFKVTFEINQIDAVCFQTILPFGTKENCAY